MMWNPSNRGNNSYTGLIKVKIYCWCSICLVKHHMLWAVNWINTNSKVQKEQDYPFPSYIPLEYEMIMPFNPKFLPFSQLHLGQKCRKCFLLHLPNNVHLLISQNLRFLLLHPAPSLISQQGGHDLLIPSSRRKIKGSIFWNNLLVFVWVHV